MSNRRLHGRQVAPDDWTASPAPSRIFEPEWIEDAKSGGCLEGPGRFALGLLLVFLAVVVIMAAGWVRSDRAVARCVDTPTASGCTPPRAAP